MLELRLAEGRIAAVVVDELCSIQIKAWITHRVVTRSLLRHHHVYCHCVYWIRVLFRLVGLVPLTAALLIRLLDVLDDGVSDGMALLLPGLLLQVG